MSTSFADKVNALYANSEKVQTRLNELAEKQVRHLPACEYTYQDPFYRLPSEVVNAGQQIKSSYGEILYQKYLEKRPNSKLFIDERGFITITDLAQEQLKKDVLAWAKTWVEEHLDTIKEEVTKEASLGREETVISFPLPETFPFVDFDKLVDNNVEEVIKVRLDLNNVGVYRTETFDIRIALSYTI
jgi:predicted metal-dependent hydrolase